MFMRIREVKRMKDVWVTPNTLWSMATNCKVEGEPGKKSFGEDIPVVAMRISPIMVTVNRSEFPDGVVILNANCLPNTTAPTELKMLPSEGNTIEVPIGEINHPRGVVVLFPKMKPEDQE
jgi:hypothetical protein